MFEALIGRLAAALEAAGLPYMIIGGQAVLFHGSPRLTKDIDITLGVDTGELGRLLGLVGAAGLAVLPADPEPFVRQTYVLPTRDQETGIRVDFIFSITPYESEAIARARTVLLRGIPVRFAAVEDVIIHKVFAGRPRDLEDVRTLVLKNPGLDRKYVREWLRRFDGSAGKTGLLQNFERLLRQSADPTSSQ